MTTGARRATVILLAVLTAACGTTEGAADADDAQSASGSEAAEGSDGAASEEVASEDAESDDAESEEVGSDAASEEATDDGVDPRLPEGFPADIPLPAGFVPQLATGGLEDDGSGSFTVNGRIEGAADPAAAVDDLVAAFEAAGFEVTDQQVDPGSTQLATVELTRGGDAAVLRFTSDERTLGLQLELDLAGG